MDDVISVQLVKLTMVSNKNVLQDVLSLGKPIVHSWADVFVLMVTT